MPDGQTVNGCRDSRNSGDDVEKQASPAGSEEPLCNEAKKVKATEHTTMQSLWRSFRQSWTKAGLNTTTILMMIKSGLPPTLATALLQVPGINNLFPDSGYIYPIISLLTLAFLPRAKFIQSVTLSVLFTCLAAALAMLAVYSSIKARQAAPSPPAADGQPGYNSSASAVLGVWLFLLIWAFSSFRARLPQFTFPVILACVFVDVICTGATKLPTVIDGVRYVRSIWECFMLGYGTGFVVHFAFFPLSMRTVIFAEFSGFFRTLRGSLKAQLEYLHSLEDPGNVKRGIGNRHEVINNHTPQAQAVKASVKAMQGAHAKLHQDLTPAKREFDFSYLSPDHINEMFKLTHKLFLPVAGLAGLVTIFERLQDIGNLVGTTDDRHYWEDAMGVEERTEQIAYEWAEFMQQLHDTFEAYVHVVDEGIEHLMLVLGIKTPDLWAPVKAVEACLRVVKRGSGRTKASENPVTSPTDDAENKAADSRPGSEKFAVYYKAKIDQLYSDKEIALRLWCQRKGIKLADDFFDHPGTADYEVKEDDPITGCEHRRKLRLLYTLFYVEYSFVMVVRAVLRYIDFADRLRAEGVMSKRRFIVPGRKRIRKWLSSIFKASGLSQNDERLPTLDMGDAYNRRGDPEHLPPRNWIERAGEHLRTMPNFLRSQDCMFGLRVALATMSVAIIAYIRTVQEYFFQERVLWCLFVIVLTMSPTAGASVFALIGRILGTVYAMLVSFAIWYMADQKTPGIIVFMWVAISISSYLFICKPQFLSYGTVGIIAILVIAGYQLEARKYKPQLHGGQPYYPILQFGPRRLLNATIGAAVAFFWTIFPYPISEHSMIRHGIGDALYLLANYHSLTNELIRARVREPDETEHRGPDDPLSPEYWLERNREKVLSKLTVRLAGLRNYAVFLKYEIPVGGRFPREIHCEIIELINSLLNFMSLANLASKSLNKCCNSQSAWSRHFRQALDSAILTNKEITILLSLFSASIDNGVPLPPYLHTPEPYHLAETLEKLNKDIFGIRHLNEPYYAAFGVMQVSASCIVKDVDDLLTNVKKLVGELDFSFHVSSTSDDPSTSLSQSRTLDYIKSREKKD